MRFVRATIDSCRRRDWSGARLTGLGREDNPTVHIALVERLSGAQSWVTGLTGSRAPVGRMSMTTMREGPCRRLPCESPGMAVVLEWAP